MISYTDRVDMTTNNLHFKVTWIGDGEGRWRTVRLTNDDDDRR